MHSLVSIAKLSTAFSIFRWSICSLVPTLSKREKHDVCWCLVVDWECTRQWHAYFHKSIFDGLYPSVPPLVRMYRHMVCRNRKPMLLQSSLMHFMAFNGTNYISSIWKHNYPYILRLVMVNNYWIQSGIIDFAVMSGERDLKSTFAASFYSMYTHHLS